jgi:chromosome segregation ATPase
MLAADLEQCRAQWKDAEHGWNEDLQDLRVQLEQAQARLATAEVSKSSRSDHESLMQKIHQLETERAELQSCLDEALKELEAVDAELQTEDGSKLNNSNKSTVESLQHLLRWIYQEGPSEKRFNPSQLSERSDTKQLVSEIQEALEDWLAHVTNSQSRSIGDNGAQGTSSVADEQMAVISELQEQIKSHQAELKSREESSGELRESLKEAVALLKPLQDAVAKAEEDKSELQQQLDDLEKDRKSSQEEMTQQSKKIKSLTEQITSLEEQLEEQKKLSRARESLLEAATPSPQKSRSLFSTPQTPGSEDSLAKIKRAREELRRKRETEGNLQQLLKDAQSRFKTLHQQNENAAAKNRELQGQIEKLGDGDNAQGSREAELGATLAQREAELQAMREQLERMQRSMQDDSSHATTSFQKIKSLEDDLTRARGELAQREQAERLLNRSLKEALGLLKPLQMHLEEAEQEKMEISRELRNLRKRFRQLQMGEGDDFSRSTMGGTHPDVSVELIKIKEELEETVRQLEMENSQLHDALEDLTEDGSKHNEAKLRQRLVELNSRYEVTQNKLEDAHVENHALLKALKQREMEEMQRKDELRQLREKLHRSETELTNAKSIAKSALVKVEELTMSNIEHLSREGPMDINLDGHEQLSGFSF